MILDPLGILLRFNEDSVAFVVDISKTFMQILLPEERLQVQRFVWKTLDACLSATNCISLNTPHIWRKTVTRHWQFCDANAHRELQGQLPKSGSHSAETPNPEVSIENNDNLQSLRVYWSSKTDTMHVTVKNIDVKILTKYLDENVYDLQSSCVGFTCYHQDPNRHAVSPEN